MLVLPPPRVITPPGGALHFEKLWSRLKALLMVARLSASKKTSPNALDPIGRSPRQANNDKRAPILVNPSVRGELLTKQKTYSLMLLLKQRRNTALCVGSSIHHLSTRDESRRIKETQPYVLGLQSTIDPRGKNLDRSKKYSRMSSPPSIPEGRISREQKASSLMLIFKRKAFCVGSAIPHLSMRGESERVGLLRQTFSLSQARTSRLQTATARWSKP
ncbi:hypothetical protein TNCV_3460431 [Trichonephila clavipes]|nr:hypothetical protein TNCV_3460431 [Trichonephila clavipes]